MDKGKSRNYIVKKLLFILLLIVSAANAKVKSGSFDFTHLEVCFGSNNDCTKLIVKEIEGAKKNILVQAYAFKSEPIIEALSMAKAHGIPIQVLIDKSEPSIRYSVETDLRAPEVFPCGLDYLDTNKGIAHNKIMIIDDDVVITGSFDNRNENTLVIKDKSVAKLYESNWEETNKKCVLSSVVSVFRDK